VAPLAPGMVVRSCPRAPPFEPFANGCRHPPASFVVRAVARSGGDERHWLPTRTITDTSTSLVPDGRRPPPRPRTPRVRAALRWLAPRPVYQVAAKVASDHRRRARGNGAWRRLWPGVADAGGGSLRPRRGRTTLGRHRPDPRPGCHHISSAPPRTS